MSADPNPLSRDRGFCEAVCDGKVITYFGNVQ